ncbi:MAG: DUF4157 domain-containing protein, partial [Bacteroidota bacterium]
MKLPQSTHNQSDRHIGQEGQPTQSSTTLSFQAPESLTDRPAANSGLSRQIIAFPAPARHFQVPKQPLQAKATLGTPPWAGLPINDDPVLEREADIMGAKAAHAGAIALAQARSTGGATSNPLSYPSRRTVTASRIKPALQPKAGPSQPGRHAIAGRTGSIGGLPAKLQTGIESLSGLPMDDVRVHYNSPKPAQLQAHAYAQGTDIHLAKGQEKHLPHEAWHVVQQKQGRVKPTVQRKTALPLRVPWRSASYNPLGFSQVPYRTQVGAPIQRKMWMLEQDDPEREFPVLLMRSGVEGFLREFKINFSPYDMIAANRLLEDDEDRYYAENLLGAQKMIRDIRAIAGRPIATVSFNYRYHSNQGTGALKYDPVNVAGSPAMNLDMVEDLRQERGGGGDPEIRFETAIAHCKWPTAARLVRNSGHP